MARGVADLPTPYPASFPLVSLYLGAFLGPFGGQVLAVLMPLLAREFTTDLAVLSLAVPAYFLPFATMQIFSGALADATSRRRAVVLGLVGYAGGSAICGLAPNVELYLGGRVLQGAANAFMTPILMATLGDVVSPMGLGRAMGRFGAANTAGNFLAPAVAGVLAVLNWRLSYLVITTISLGLAAIYWRLYGAKRNAASASGRAATTVPEVSRNVIAILRGPMLPLGLTAAVGYVGVAGSQYLWPTYLADAWQVPPHLAGPAVSLFGLSGIASGFITGTLADRLGRLRLAGAATAGATGLYLLLFLSPAPLPFGLVLGGMGLTLAAFWTGINTHVVEVYAARRGAAASIFGSFRFLATTVSPLLYTPLYLASGRVIFLAAAAVSGGAAVLLAVTWKEPTPPRDHGIDPYPFTDPARIPATK